MLHRFTSLPLWPRTSAVGNEKSTENALGLHLMFGRHQPEGFG